MSVLGPIEWERLLHFLETRHVEGHLRPLGIFKCEAGWYRIYLRPMLSDILCCCLLGGCLGIGCFFFNNF